MEALAIAPTFDYKADWYSPGYATGRRPLPFATEAAAHAATDRLLPSARRDALSEEEHEIFEMRVLEFSSRQALTRCFIPEWGQGADDGAID
jgi:hypothetical protein